MTSETSYNPYVFILGRERQIALEELKTVLGRVGFYFSISSLSGNIALLNISNADDTAVRALIDILGGTIKIFRIIFNCHPGDEGGRISSQKKESFAGAQDEILKIILNERPRGRRGKLNFGISDYSGKIGLPEVNKIGLKLKRELEHRKINSRFIALREGRELSSIVSLKNNLADRGVEIGLFDQSLGVLIALSNPEEWSRRDFGKPAGDKRSGMTPPKLARMMVNIALDFRFKAESRNNIITQAQSLKPLVCLVIDPFCGSGNILSEAIMLGCDVIGSDISEKAVGETKQNLEWLMQVQNSSAGRRSKSQNHNSKPRSSEDLSFGFKLCALNFNVFRADAREEDYIKNLLPKIKNYDQVAIVTEPYLGGPKKIEPNFESVTKEYAQVKQIYLGFLRNIVSLLRRSIIEAETQKQYDNIIIQQLNICIIFPLVETSDRGRFSLYAESVDEIRKLGYTQIRPPLIYGRDYQIVKRQIAFLQFLNINPPAGGAK